MTESLTRSGWQAQTINLRKIKAMQQCHSSEFEGASSDHRL